MTEQSNTPVDDAPRDKWEESRLAVPAISFFEKRRGEGFDYIVIPCPRPGRYFGKGYEIVYDMEPAKITVDGEEVDNPNFGQPKRWPPRGRQTVGEAKTQTVLWVMCTGLQTPTDFMSERAIERFKNATTVGEPEDLAFIAKVKEFGLRRLFITGGSLQPQMDKAIRAQTGKPVAGAFGYVGIKEKERNKYQGYTNIFEVRYEKPTDETKAKVAAYLVDPIVIEDTQSEGDPWGNGTGHEGPASNGGSTPSNWQTEPVRGPSNPAPVPAAPAADDEPPF